ncbi:MAG: outer membrane protein transport protein [Mariprofundus sp.]|nr:outer membrane protein transport protein [Mariprofundus sp.]
MKRVLIIVAAMLTGLTHAQAGGFEQPNQSASAAGVANAFVATANDASALMYNPAGIAWLSGVSVMGTGRLDYRDSSVQTLLRNAPNNGTEPFTGSIYATWTPRDGHLAAGFGFSPLFIANNDWDTAFPAAVGRSASGITKLTVDHTTVDFVYALNSDLAIGAGGDWYVTRATLTQGVQSFQGNSFTSFGGHASLMWKPFPAWSVGAMFRSGANVNMSGQANDSLSFRLPDYVSVGIAHDFADVWHLETDIKWTRWSALKDMNIVKGGLISQPNPMNLRDTLTVMTGLIWTWREKTQFRIGYAYDQGANRSQNFSPVIADQDGHRISMGIGADAFGLHMDAAYQYIYHSKNTTTGAFAGIYKDRRQTLMMSVSAVFD